MPIIEMMKRYIITFTILLLLTASVQAGSYAAPKNELKEIGPLNIHSNSELKALRKSVRTAIYTVKGRRPVDDLPSLTFYRHTVKKGETFWTILSKTNLDIDTLISVNDIDSPDSIKPEKKLFLPNMRGTVVHAASPKEYLEYLRIRNIDPIYVLAANRCTDFNKDYLFVPCAKLSKLERSLFMGTGFMSPVRHGRKSSGFGTRKDPFNSRRTQFHRGIDIACPINTPVMASRSGKVTFCGYRSGYGKLVIIKHEHGYSSYYGHLHRIHVKAGQIVKRGDIIARSGNTGRSTGPHIHFEVRKNRRAVNPGRLVSLGW
jgi:murein DD-endopeptidase MepM/ murein hydrolase activator NlpD